MTTAPEVALTLTTGQLWGALLVIGAAFLGLIVYIYNRESSLTDARINGLNAKLEKEITALREDFNNKLAAQNQQLDRTVTALQDVTDQLRNSVEQMDKRLLRHEVRMGG